jgi:hypothetical protein
MRPVTSSGRPRTLNGFALADLMNLVRAIIFIVAFAALALFVTLASCYFFPEGPRAMIAADPWYEVRHALRDRTTMLAFAGIGGIIGLIFFTTYWSVSRKLLRRHRLRSGLCVTCGYDLRGGHSRCPECGVAASLLAS